MPTIDALENLQSLLLRLNEFCKDPQPSYEFKKWQKEARLTIERIFGHHGDQINEFNAISFSLLFTDELNPKFRTIEQYQDGLEKSAHLLQTFINEVSSTSRENALQQDSLRVFLVEQMCGNFHVAARHLSCGTDESQAFAMRSEFEIHNTFHAFLKLFFDDIVVETRPSDYDETYADTDYLLYEGRVVVTLKQTLSDRPKRDIGEELLSVVRHYQNHPHCRDLVCFVYDPEFRISKPHDLEKALSELKFGIQVKTIVRPT